MEHMEPKNMEVLANDVPFKVNHVNIPKIMGCKTHSQTLTWIPTIAIFERRYIFPTIFLGSYVKFWPRHLLVC